MMVAILPLYELSKMGSNIFSRVVLTCISKHTELSMQYSSGISAIYHNCWTFLGSSLWRFLEINSLWIFSDATTWKAIWKSNTCDLAMQWCIDLWLDLKLEMLTWFLTWAKKNLLGPSSGQYSYSGHWLCFIQMLRKLYFTMIIMWQVIFIETVCISKQASPLSECDVKTLKAKLQSLVHSLKFCL